MIDRACPVCDGVRREKLYSYTLTNGLNQTVYACSCGMLYSTNPSSADYSNTAVYTAPNAIGSGTTEADRNRLSGIVDALIAAGIPKNSSILDVGCAQGGLLDVLRDRGYLETHGMDPSLSCVAASLERGHFAYQGLLSDDSLKYDVIILSHVLEHIENLQEALSDILRRLKYGGKVYIEVPDASRYGRFGLPFLDFNSEHINHFDACSLKHALEGAGLFGGIVQEKTFLLADGSRYPSIWIITSRAKTVINVSSFIEKSTETLEKSKRKLLEHLVGYPDVIVWGAGEYLSHVLPLLETKRIVQLIDRNPALWGSRITEVEVESPASIKKDIPIVVAAIVAAPAIKRDIEAAGLENLVITVEVE